MSVQTVQSCIFRSVLCDIAMEEVLLWSIFACCIVKKKIGTHQRNRSFKWSRKWLLKRRDFSHIRLLRILRDEPNKIRQKLARTLPKISHGRMIRENCGTKRMTKRSKCPHATTCRCRSRFSELMSSVIAATVQSSRRTQNCAVFRSTRNVLSATS